MGVKNPLDYDVRWFVSVVYGWLMDGKDKDQREELDRLLGGDEAAIDRSMDEAIRESYIEDGMTELQIDMLERQRHEPDPQKRAKIRVEMLERHRQNQEQADH